MNYQQRQKAKLLELRQSVKQNMAKPIVHVNYAESRTFMYVILKGWGLVRVK